MHSSAGQQMGELERQREGKEVFGRHWDMLSHWERAHFF